MVNLVKISYFIFAMRSLDFPWKPDNSSDSTVHKNSSIEILDQVIEKLEIDPLIVQMENPNSLATDTVMMRIAS